MPDWQAHIRPRLAELALSPVREAEIIEELSQHLDDRYRLLRSGGRSDAEAERLALEELRDAGAIARQMRLLQQARGPAPIVPGARSGATLRDIVQDVRYAGRLLRKQPAFTAAAVLTLALGIGANAAVFSLVNATLFQRLPVVDPERLAYISRGGGVFSYPLYAALRDNNQGLEALAGWGGITASLHAGESAELVGGLIVSGNFFDVLGVSAARGRLLGPADDVTPGAHPVAVISHEFWRTRFAGQPDAVGREIRLNGHVFTIVGVAPAGFPGPQLGSVRHLYVPMMMQAIMRPPRARYSGDQNPDLLKHPTNSWISAVGRLKPGVSMEQVHAELDAAAAVFARSLSETAEPPGAVPRVGVVGFVDGLAAQRGRVRPVALLLGGVVGAVLLIACANIANLLLSRAAARRRELAVRLALGASGGRIVRQLLTESVLLAVVGGVAGIALAWGVAEAFRASPPPTGALPLPLDFTLDQRVLLFTLLLSCATGILFGLAPALACSRPELVPALKDLDAMPRERGRFFDLKKALVVGEVALSLLLLITAGLFVRSLHAVSAIHPGIDVERLVSAPLNINLLRYTRAQGRDFYRRAVERIEQLPGVDSAAVARVALLGGSGRALSLHVEGRAASHGRASSEGGRVVTGSLTEINANVVGPRYFPTLGIGVVAGRDFNDADLETSPPVVILNATAAHLHFAGGNPLGQRVSVDGPNGPWREVVGIVRDSKYGSLSESDVPVAYLPLGQNHETGMWLYVRASGSPGLLIPGIRREIQALEPNLPVPNIQTMTQTIGTSLYAPRMGAWLLSAFGALALVLAAVGIYGVLSFAIARRTREMGIRLALGADRQHVFLLVLRDGMLLVLIGVLIGVAGGLAGARSLASLLNGVSPTDWRTFGATIAVLCLVALIACVIPARRAIRLNPITALRQD